MHPSWSKLDQTPQSVQKGTLVKRKLMIVSAFVLCFVVGITLMGNTAANAKGKPAPATDPSSLVANVYINYSQDYNGNFVVYASQFDHMEATEWGSYPVFEPCAPEVCGTLVISHKGKTPTLTLTLSKLATETLVSGSKSYSSPDYSQYHYYTWDGSSIPLVRKFKDSGKPVSVPLQYASISLYLEGAPVPPSGSCCK